MQRYTLPKVPYPISYFRSYARLSDSTMLVDTYLPVDYIAEQPILLCLILW